MFLGLALYVVIIFKAPFLLLWLIVLYLAAKFTDLLDGYLARIFNRQSDWGEFIDTLADKFFYLMGFWALLKLWPLVLAFHLMFLIIAVSVLIVVGNGLRRYFLRQPGRKSQMLRQLFEGLGYVLAMIMLLIHYNIG